MGHYYIAVSHSKREYFAEVPSKLTELIYNQSMIWYVIKESWQGGQVETIGDNEHIRFKKIRREYKDISEEIQIPFYEETGLNVDIEGGKNKENINKLKIGDETPLITVSHTQREYLKEYPASLNIRCRGASLIWILLNSRWAKDIIEIIPLSECPVGYRDITEETYEPLEGDKWVNIGIPKYIGGKWSFKESDISGDIYNEAELENIDFTGAKCTETFFGGAKLKNAVFKGADLENADFAGADLENADFTGAKLKNTNFKASNLYKTSANLKGVKGL